MCVSRGSRHVRRRAGDQEARRWLARGSLASARVSPGKGGSLERRCGGEAVRGGRAVHVAPRKAKVEGVRLG